ncbi:MAG: translocation/assembly module TamB domain-containing protein [Bacteroidetes bacterium]|nr:translocation/assembly module TamB domain-containing protein [Bacteroidota bacterium]
MVELLLVFLIFLAFAVRTSWFQTWAAQQVAAYLSSEWGTDVAIDRVDIVFFDRVDIEGVYVADKFNDTLLYSGLIHADIADWSLRKSFVTLERAELNDTYCYIRKYQGDSTFNFQHIVDYFASDEPEDTTKSAFTVNINAIALNNINFIYQDQNAEKVSHGMDFANLHFQNLSGEFNEFGLVGDSISVNISNLRFKEQSGFTLAELSTRVLYCPEIISLNKLKLAFNNSLLLADYFELQTPKGGTEFSNFVEEVRFNAYLSNSRVSMADVAYFVPSLWGMDDVVKIDNLKITGPVYGMRLKETRIRMLDHTLIAGDFQIPKLNDMNSAIFSERIDTFRTSIGDIEKLNLSPFLKDGMKHIEVPSNFERAHIVTLTAGHFDGGLESFVVDGDLNSGLGSLKSQYGIQFTKKEDGLYYYDGPDGNPHGEDIIVSNVNLRAISGNPMLGDISGYLDIDGKGFSEKDLSINFAGNLTTIGLNGYNYHGIKVKKGNFAHNVFTGVIDIEDDNLALNYDGKVDLNGSMFFDFTVKIDSAHLADLNFTNDSIANRFQSKIKVQVRGTSMDNLSGDVRISDLSYKEKNIDFEMDTLSLTIRRSKESDTIKLFSPYLTVDLTGKFDFTDIYPVLQTQLSYVVDNLVPPKEVAKTKNKYFDLDIHLTNVNPLLQFFDDQMYIAEDSRIQSYYNVSQKRFALDVNVETLLYHGMSLNEIKLENRFDSLKASVYYQAQYAKLNDSVQVRNLYIDSYVKNNTFLTNLGWDGYKGTEPALFAFKTVVDQQKNVLTDFDPSFFYLKEDKWEINPSSKILWNPDLIQLSKFNISHDDHLVSFDGKISKNPNDWLYFYVEDFDLSDLNGMLGGDITLGGILNIDGGVADVYDNIRFQSVSDVTNFVVNGELVGDLMVGSQWDKTTNSIGVLGNLKRDKSETFRFEGNYWMDKEEDNIQLDLLFDYTDISFLNAFEDPELYTDIEGILNGELKVTGELTNPVINGDLDILMAGVMVPMFNVGFGFSGGVEFGEGEIIVNHMDLFDQEGNQAYANMQIYHDDWSGFNYDVTLDMEDPSLSEKFLVMNTVYEEGSYYYGKAYISGLVNIFGYDDLVQITVDATTKKGTDLVLPLYGTSELEETSFIKFTKPEDTTAVTIVEEIERMGMTLDMKFHVTQEAQVTIVFEPVYGDQIVARGVGDIEIAMDDYGEMTMFGKYQILKGVYNMRMKTLVREDFAIDPESTIRWTRSPYDADIDITATFDRTLSLQDVMPPGTTPRGNNKDLVRGYLLMSKTLMAPQLDFNIDAPESDQEGKDAVKALTAEKDMLTKQFFAILVLQRFIPVYGTGEAGSGALGVLEDQMNAMFDAISGNFKISANLTGTKGFQVQRQLSDNVTVSVSGGVVEGDEQSASTVVGDVRVEYQLNEDGTFTMNFFNESNSGAETDQGAFTQGVSMHYQETFETTKEFKLLQGFLNIFRPESKDIKIRDASKPNRRRTPVPAETTPTNT